MLESLILNPKDCKVLLMREYHDSNPSLARVIDKLYASSSNNGIGGLIILSWYFTLLYQALKYETASVVRLLLLKPNCSLQIIVEFSTQVDIRSARRAVNSLPTQLIKDIPR